MQRASMSSLLLVLCLSGCQGIAERTAPSAQVKQMPVDGATLAYFDQGNGPTVVMVHGAFSDGRNWDGIRAIVAQRYRVVVPSLRYHHPNAWTDDGARYSLVPAAVQQRVFDNANSIGPYSRQPAAPPVTCDQFRALRMPALVSSGEMSRAIFRVGSDMMAECLATRVEDIPNGRHDWFAALPDAGARAILAFLDQQPR